MFDPYDAGQRRLPTKRTKNVRWTTLELQEIYQALRFLQDWRQQQKDRLRLYPPDRTDVATPDMEGANASARAKISRLLSESPRDPDAPV